MLNLLYTISLQYTHINNINDYYIFLFLEISLWEAAQVNQIDTVRL